MILIGSFLIFLWLSWNLALKETFILAGEIGQIRTDLKALEDAPNKIRLLEGKLKKVEGKTKQLHSGVLEMRKALLSEVSDLANKYQLSLKNFPDYFSQQKEGIELTTSSLVLSGDFKQMVQFIDEFERMKISGKISSASFKIDESPRTKKRSLYLTLYVQSINL